MAHGKVHQEPLHTQVSINGQLDVYILIRPSCFGSDDSDGVALDNCRRQKQAQPTEAAKAT